MNKNPFVPQPSYTPQQPPLPPGPPPPQPAQPDYTAYWAAAAAQQQQQQQQHQAPPVPYNPQWSAPQPTQARSTPEQSALYANYGYGGQAGLHWQQQQRQAQAGAQPPPVGHYPAPPPVVQVPPPPPQPAYNPYQPAAGYPQPYVPQVAPPPQQPLPIQQPYPPPPQQQQQQQQPQQYYPQPHPPPQQPQPQQPQQPRNNSHLHHTPPHQLRPAKRPRFESHSQNSRVGHQFPPPTQPQFQAPPPPPQQGAPMGMYGSGQNQAHSQGGAQMGGGRGGASGNRGGGSVGGRGSGRGGSMSGTRGGASGGRGGRGGSMFLGGGGGRGGSSGQAAPLRGHGSRGGFGNTKDYHNRRGGSFTSGGGHSHQSSGSSSFRGGRGQNHSSGRGGRHDGGGSGGGPSAFGARDGPMNSSFSSSGKKDENRRTLTDFKIVGLEMRELGWNWGILPSPALPPPPLSVKPEAKDGASAGLNTSDDLVKHEEKEAVVPPNSEKVDDVAEPDNIAGSNAETVPVESKPAATATTKATTKVPTGPSKDAHSASLYAASVISSPPSRIRIYFHTPVSADDSHPISLNATSSFSLGLSTPLDSRKGKRKKLEDDDGDLEEGRGKRPPPPMGNGGGSQISDSASVDIDATGRGSVAPSVAETSSEADWLMAAIVQDEGDGTQDEDGNGDGTDNKLNISHIEDIDDTEVGDRDDASNDLLVTDGHGSHPAENLDGQTDQERAHGSSRIESNGFVEAGPNSTSAAIAAAAITAAVDGSKLSTVPPNGVNTSADVTAAKPIEGAPAVDGDACPVESETLIEPNDTSGSSTSYDVISSVTALDQTISSEEQSTNVGYPDTQVPHLLVGGKPLQASASLASTIPDDDAQADNIGSFNDDGAVATINPDSSQDKPVVGDVETEVDSFEQDHLPEPPASPTSNTLLSTSSGSTYGEPGSQNTSTSLSAPVSPTKVDGKTVKSPSANRLSISYAAGSRRLVVDACVVEKLKVFRNKGRIEVIINIEKEGENGLKGILIEGLSETTKSYAPLPTLPADHSSLTDPTIPTFSEGPIPSQIILIAHLDTERPLSEPKWVKTGDVHEWLKSMFGRMFWVAGDAADGWERKIEVVDPDPAPTIWTILESWSVNSPVGLQTERQRFLKTHMSSEPENILEILLRLVRGERATPFSGSGSSASIIGSSISGPLLAALSSSGNGGFAHGEKQTHVSLAVLAIWRMTLEYARKAAAADKDGETGSEAAVKEVEEKIGEIIRCLPGHLVYKSLDGMFKEWRIEKKGGKG